MNFLIVDGIRLKMPIPLHEKPSLIVRFLLAGVSINQERRMPSCDILIYACVLYSHALFPCTLSCVHHHPLYHWPRWSQWSNFSALWLWKSCHYIRGGAQWRLKRSFLDLYYHAHCPHHVHYNVVHFHEHKPFSMINTEIVGFIAKPHCPSQE